jgi:hypothetical protein
MAGAPLLGRAMSPHVQEILLALAVIWVLPAIVILTGALIASACAAITGAATRRKGQP